jgi:hypothetical protein
MSDSFSKRIENIAGHLKNSVLNLIPGDTMATNGVNGSGSRGTMKAQQYAPHLYPTNQHSNRMN